MPCSECQPGPETCRPKVPLFPDDASLCMLFRGNLRLRANTQASAAERHQPGKASQSFLPRVHFGLVAKKLLGGGLRCGQGYVLGATRTFQHPAASPAAPPTDDVGVFGGQTSDLDVDLLVEGRRDGGRRAHSGTSESAPARVAEIQAAERVRLQERAGDDPLKLLSTLPFGQRFDHGCLNRHTLAIPQGNHFHRQTQVRRLTQMDRQLADTSVGILSAWIG